MSELRPRLSKIEDYPACLETCWQEHLLPKAADAPTVISLFAGCGGSSLGYSMAGFKELLAVDWDDNAIETFKSNFPDVPVYHDDIVKVSIDGCTSLAEIQPGELEILDGSPPCQGFSTSGRRQFADSRNDLFREYVRLLRGMRPKAFVMENVSGLVKGKMKLIFAEIMRDLKASGYKVSTRLLNAMYFGVPQSRQRLIFIGVRDDLEIIPSHPRAETIPVEADKAIVDADISNVGRPKEPWAARMKEVKPGSSLGRIDNKGSLFSYVRCPIGKPAMTLQKSITFGDISMWHPIEERNCSIGELKRIGSFPDSFFFNGNYEETVNCIGDSVPPLFMRSIAKHIRKTVLDMELESRLVS